MENDWRWHEKACLEDIIFINDGDHLCFFLHLATCNNQLQFILNHQECGTNGLWTKGLDPWPQPTTPSNKQWLGYRRYNLYSCFLVFYYRIVPTPYCLIHLFTIFFLTSYNCMITLTSINSLVFIGFADMFPLSLGIWPRNDSTPWNECPPPLRRKGTPCGAWETCNQWWKIYERPWKNYRIIWILRQRSSCASPHQKFSSERLVIEAKKGPKWSLERVSSSLEEEDDSMWSMHDLQSIVRGMQTTVTNLQNFVNFDIKVTLHLTSSEILKWAVGGRGKKGAQVKVFDIQIPWFNDGHRSSQVSWLWGV